MQRLNPPIPIRTPRSGQLIEAKDVALKLGVSVSWVIQHAYGKRQPYLRAIKMGPGRAPLRFDPSDIEKFIDECRGMAESFASRAKRKKK